VLGCIRKGIRCKTCQIQCVCADDSNEADPGNEGNQCCSQVTVIGLALFTTVYNFLQTVLKQLYIDNRKIIQKKKQHFLKKIAS